MTTARTPRKPRPNQAERDAFTELHDDEFCDEIDRRRKMLDVLHAMATDESAKSEVSAICEKLDPSFTLRDGGDDDVFAFITPSGAAAWDAIYESAKSEVIRAIAEREAAAESARIAKQAKDESARIAKQAKDDAARETKHRAGQRHLLSKIFQGRYLQPFDLAQVRNPKSFERMQGHDLGEAGAKGFFVFGPSGSGKTFAVVHLLCDITITRMPGGGAPFYFLPVVLLAELISGGLRTKEELTKTLGDIKGRQILFLDDIGIPKITPRLAETLYSLIETHGGPVIITSQYQPKGLFDKWVHREYCDMELARALARRMMQYCVPIDFSPPPPA